MKRYLLAFALAGLVGGGLVAKSVWADEKEHKHEQKDDDKDDSKSVDIKVDELPAKVKEAFAKDFPGMTISEAEKETYKDGTVHYEIEYKDKDGKEHDVEYTADGEKLDEHGDKDKEKEKN